jgi:hypothetical protein
VGLNGEEDGAGQAAEAASSRSSAPGPTPAAGSHTPMHFLSQQQTGPVPIMQNKFSQDPGL